MDELPCGHTRRIMIGGKCGECTIYPPPRPTFDTTMPPREWCRAYGVSVLDPDGWRGNDASDWDAPVTLVEFERRALLSTADLANPAWAGVSRDARLCEQDAGYAALAAAQDDEDRAFHAAVRGRRRDVPSDAEMDAALREQLAEDAALLAEPEAEQRADEDGDS